MFVPTQKGLRMRRILRSRARAAMMGLLLHVSISLLLLNCERAEHSIHIREDASGEGEFNTALLHSLVQLRSIVSIALCSQAGIVSLSVNMDLSFDAIHHRERGIEGGREGERERENTSAGEGW